MVTFTSTERRRGKEDMNIIQKIKLLLKVKKSAGNVKEAYMKSGVKTTEFWMTVVSNLVTIIGALGGNIEPEKAAILLAVLNGIYSVLRSLVKQPEITTVVNNEKKK